MKSLSGLEELLHAANCTPIRVCEELSRIFGVALTEVGLLSREGDHLLFLYPAELRAAGSIPLSSTAVAARTAVTSQPELFNRFANVPHHNVFETIKLTNGTEPQSDSPTTIQKLMSAPLVDDDGAIVGVVQISPKGLAPVAAGPDFNLSDLDLLVRYARRIALLIPDLRVSHCVHSGKLRFKGTSKPQPRYFGT